MQRLIGPKYNFFETYAEMYYDVADKPIDDIKRELKQIIAANRYKYEVAGITVNIQNQDIKIFTNREDRGLYLQAFQLGKDNINWKFGDVFLTLSNNDLSSIVQSIADHVQACFDWEATKNAEIDSATFEQLDSINLKSDNTIWEPIMEQLIGVRL